MAQNLKTIFFDVGNTLLFPDRTRILAPLAHKANPTLEQWQAIERATKPKFDDLLQRGGPVDHGFWHMFYSSLLAECGAEEDGLMDALLVTTHDSGNWCVIRPGTREALQRLGKRYRMAIISNADGKVAEVVRRCGIADCFASITDSGVVGYEKPHPVIFQTALRAMEAKPEESLYVGDVYSVDYLGATGAGMQAVLFDVAGAYRELGVARVESLEELEGRLK